MTMDIQITDSDIRKLVPLTYQEGRGENSLLDKIEPYIRQAKCFLYEKIIPEELMCEDILQPAKEIVAAYAMYLAVPSLDVSLTSTGFAVGSNDSLAPASPHRVRALRESLMLSRDKAIEAAAVVLPDVPGWKDSGQAGNFLSTLLSMQEVSVAVSGSLSFDTFLQCIHEVQAVEYSVAMKYISEPLLLKLRSFVKTGHGDVTERQAVHYRRILPAVRSFILKWFLLAKGLLADPAILDYERLYIYDVVNYIREHPRGFPEWHESAVAALFGRTGFRNQKKSGGYFF